MTNPFKQPTNIWKLELVTPYFMLPIFEEYFANFTDNISCYEISSKTVESADDDIWCFEAYLPEKPDLDKICKALQKIIFNANNEWDYSDSIKVTNLEDIDWVKKVQENFAPINLGSFFITNPVNSHLCPQNMQKIIIDASQAFGTGEHSTTQGCIEAMESLRNKDFKEIFDIGTGSGILAIVAAKIWPNANVTGSDIEELSVKIAKHHAAINNVQIRSILADGIFLISDKNNDEGFTKSANLIISNILAVPLINMASDFTNIIAEDGFLILSGFLDYQLPDVLDSYIKNGFSQLSIINKKGWITLIMQNTNTKP